MPSCVVWAFENMGLMPAYRVQENVFPALETMVAEVGLDLVCIQPMHLQNDGVTMYRGWEIKRAETLEVIMWDQHRVDRAKDDATVVLTLGTPRGRKGQATLSIVERALSAIGGHKLA